jgi:hypothetical protein
MQGRRQRNLGKLKNTLFPPVHPTFLQVPR